MCLLLPVLQMPGSTTVREFLMKYCRWKFYYILQEIFVILYTGMPYTCSLLTAVYKSVFQACAEIEIYHDVRHDT
jgi:hypothetical protein